ncbi:MAG TPA: hypothetical protein VMT32_12220 [Bryobacteraceae bacterium]|nr:hypothetical protein [Bryobacteraceae bacterium]
MNRRELFQKAFGAGAAVVAASVLRGQSASFNGPAGGSRGSTLVTIVTGPFDTSSYPNGVRALTDTPQFATYVRIQAHPGQQGKIAIGNSAMASATGNVADSAFLELWPNWDGTLDNGRSDTWILSDPEWNNTINLADIYVWPEIAGETPVITAFQLA